jgi:hypothetical protein
MAASAPPLPPSSTAGPPSTTEGPLLAWQLMKASATTDIAWPQRVREDSAAPIRVQPYLPESCTQTVPAAVRTFIMRHLRWFERPAVSRRNDK